MFFHGGSGTRLIAHGRTPADIRSHIDSTAGSANAAITIAKRRIAARFHVRFT
jgi:hypothetical protein